MNRSRQLAPTRWAVAVAALAVGSTLLSACGSGGSSGGSTPASAAAAPKAGGTLTFAVGSDAGCVDPQQAGSNDTIYSLRQIVDSLTDQDPKTGKIVPWLARSWEISADAKTFTFHLKPGVTFSDGTPLTAQVVKDNFEALPKLGTLATLGTGYLGGLAGIKAIDAQTIEIDFQQPNAQFLQATSTFSLGIVSEASVQKTPQARCGDGIIGSGPFVLSKYVAGQSISLKKRTGYTWGSSLFTKSGDAYLDALEFKVVPEAGVRTSSLQSGQVDAIGAVAQSDEAALRGSGAQLLARANPGVVFGLNLNNSRPIFADPNVRKALLLAVNRQQIVDTVFPTGTRPATSVLAHTTPDYADLSSSVTFNATKAGALLDAAGWKLGAGGIRQKDGAPLAFTITWFANAATNQPALELVQQQLKAVGVQVDLKQLQIAQISQTLTGGDFDVLWGNVTRADPDILRGQFSTKGLNAYKLPATDLDTVLAQQAAEPDPTKRAALVRQAQQLVVDNAYVVPVVELETELGVGKNVHDLNFEASSRIQLHDTWKS
ncbi:ABC transporter substrate-binding protein [Pseudofrankia inefficax]|uniref:ABC transporter substrate-binding protein n=1 Tax=Pseudofrankia inefficax (strain DSM 45817 / CECT 9037 / DDB 130130 / EuI1c) TaxID=298654 RepID=UPI00059DEAD7|nr:ABC transporter substrate-binding protein [Pseudofrankia inefficax]